MNLLQKYTSEQRVWGESEVFETFSQCLFKVQVGTFTKKRKSLKLSKHVDCYMYMVQIIGWHAHLTRVATQMQT